MNLEKAIEISRNYIITRNATLDPDVKESIRLGIEVLKGIVSLRKGHGKALSELLPGETKE